MHLTNYPGKFDKEVIKERAISALSEQWIIREEGNDLFLERKGIDTTLLMHQSRSMRRHNIPFISGVRLRFHANKVEASLSFNHTFYIFMFLALATIVLLFLGKKKLQDMALVALGGGIFYFVVTDKVLKELRKVF